MYEYTTKNLFDLETSVLHDRLIISIRNKITLNSLISQGHNTALANRDKLQDEAPV